jgi:hypothetical protein
LYGYVSERVATETPRQTPGKWAYKQQGDIVIARNPHPVAQPSQLPPELQQSMEDPRTWVREGAVSALDPLLRGGNKGLALAARAALERLKEDDSRRVSTAATRILEEYEAVQRPVEERAVNTGPKGEEKAEVQRMPSARTQPEPFVPQRVQPEQEAAEKTRTEAGQQRGYGSLFC